MIFKLLIIRLIEIGFVYKFLNKAKNFIQSHSNSNDFTAYLELLTKKKRIHSPTNNFPSIVAINISNILNGDSSGLCTIKAAQVTLNSLIKVKENL